MKTEPTRGSPTGSDAVRIPEDAQRRIDQFVQHYDVASVREVFEKTCDEALQRGRLNAFLDHAERTRLEPAAFARECRRDLVQAVTNFTNWCETVWTLVRDQAREPPAVVTMLQGRPWEQLPP